MYMSDCGFMHVSAVSSVGKKRVVYPLELKLWAFANHGTWLLESRLGSSERAASAGHC